MCLFDYIILKISTVNNSLKYTAEAIRRVVFVTQIILNVIKLFLKSYSKDSIFKDLDHKSLSAVYGSLFYYKSIGNMTSKRKLVVRLQT